jgi:hypothetical protein
MLRQTDVQQALAHPAIRTIMITAYDGVSWPDCEAQLFLNPGFYTAENRVRLVDEYAAFTYELYRTYSPLAGRALRSGGGEAP